MHKQVQHQQQLTHARPPFYLLQPPIPILFPLPLSRPQIRQILLHPLNNTIFFYTHTDKVIIPLNSPPFALPIGKKNPYNCLRFCKATTFHPRLSHLIRSNTPKRNQRNQCNQYNLRSQTPSRIQPHQSHIIIAILVILLVTILTLSHPNNCQKTYRALSGLPGLGHPPSNPPLPY